MGEYADATCGRCGKPFLSQKLKYYPRLGIYGTSMDMPHSYCSSCRSKREESFNKAVRSASTSIKAIRHVDCPQCGGSGYIRGGGYKAKCSRCFGTGNVRNSTVRNLLIPDSTINSMNRELGTGEDYTLGAYDPQMRNEIKKHLPLDYDDKDAKACFITTACIKSKGLEDNCLELKLLRNFRDDFVLLTDKGILDMQQYSNIAPQIIKSIDSQPNPKELYNDIFNRMIKKAVGLIERGKQEETYDLYKDGIMELKERFL